MAKKKVEEAPKGAPAWMATFSDLMNLLLCFFVLLFSMSSVDAAKFDQVVNSLSNSFSIFSSGSTGIQDGQLVSNGVSQLQNIGEELNEQGDSEESNDKKQEVTSVEQAQQVLAESQKQQIEEMYEEISGLIDKNKIDEYVSVGVDDNYQFVKISMYGGVLFDSGAATVKPASYQILKKVGAILSVYRDRLIKIQGHTDNVPMHNAVYENNFQLSTARANAVAEYLISECKLKGNNVEPSGRGEYDPIADNKTAEGRAKNRRVEFKIYNEDSNER